MNVELESRVREHHRSLADGLEVPPARFADVLERSAETRVDDAPDETRARHQQATWLAVAAGFVLFVGGLVLIANRLGGDSADESIAAPPPLLSSVVTAESDQWVVASRLPPGVVYMYAHLGFPSDSGRTVVYGNHRASGTFERIRITIDPQTVMTGEPIDIDGTEWRVDDPLTGGWTAQRSIGPSVVTVRDSGAFTDEARDLVAGLVVVDDDELPSPPLGDESEAVEVASAGPDAQFLVQESGGYWWVQLGGSGGCCSAIDTESSGVTVDGGTTTVNEGTSMANIVIGGTAVDAAARVEVEFRDGTVVETTPDDPTGEFDRKFWVVDAELPADDRTPVEVRSYGANGELLATLDRSEWTP